MQDPLEVVHRTAKPIADVAALFTIVAIPIVSLRLYAASGFDRNTALALTSYTTLSVFAVAAFVTITQSLFAAASFILLAHVGLRPAPRNPAWWVRLLLGIALAVTVIYSSETVDGLITYSLALALAPVFGVIYGRTIERSHPFDVRVFVYAALLMQLIFVATSRGLWLPPERLVIATTERTAYVLHETEDRLAILYDNDRIVAWVDKKDVKQRQFCSLRQTSPLRVSGKAGRPDCP